MYVYELTAYEYSDYTTWLLVHDEKFTEKKFKAIVAEADSKIKTEWIHSNYVSDLISMLCQQYGFKSVKPISCRIGGFEGSPFHTFK